jgi:hypothetical protein
VSESVSEKAKLIRGDPPKIDFKKKGEPLQKYNHLFFSKKFCTVLVNNLFIYKITCSKFEKISPKMRKLKNSEKKFKNGTENL